MKTSGRLMFHAQLLGGKADGQLIELESRIPRVAVYQNGAGALAADPSAPPPANGGVLVGEYRLVGPVGSETPVYVAAP
jgi:hypothetical protein